MGLENSHPTLNCKQFQCVPYANNEFNQSGLLETRFITYLLQI